MFAAPGLGSGISQGPWFLFLALILETQELGVASDSALVSGHERRFLPVSWYGAWHSGPEGKKVWVSGAGFGL